MTNDVSNIFVKDNIFDLPILGLDFGADYDSHGNIRIGDTVECSDGTLREYDEFDRIREEVLLSDENVDPHYFPLLRFESGMTYDLGDLESPLQRVCATEPDVLPPQR